MSQNQSAEQGATVGPSIISSPLADTRTLSHRGDEVGSSNVTRSQNTADTLTEILEWTVPEKYEEMVVAGGRHWTKAILRRLETFDGDGAATTFAVSGDLIAQGGETEIDDQPHPVAVVYDADAATQHTIASVDYVANEITLDSAPTTGTDNVKIWYVMGDGEVQYRAEDSFEHEVGPLNEWTVPVHVFGDFNQDKNTTQIHIPGAGKFTSDERLKLMLDAPGQVVWEDSDYPEGQFVSSLEQRADVRV